MTFQEAQIHSLIIEAEALRVRVISMQAHDASCPGSAGRYTEGSYSSIADQLDAISGQIQGIAREGGLS